MSIDVDVLIIGAGVLGTSVARNLSQYKLDVAILEKDMDVCSGISTSKATSSILHSGYEFEPDSLKAKYIVKGTSMMLDLCEELDVPYKNPGQLEIVLNKEEIKSLEEKKERGEINGVPGLEIIEKEELHSLEPNLNPEAEVALFAPTGGIVCPYELVIAQLENAMDNGVDFYRNTEVKDLKLHNDKWKVKTNNKTFKTNYVVNAAGIFADKISKMAGAKKFTISPLRGEEYILDRETKDLVNHLLSGPNGFVIPTTHDNIMTGTIEEKSIIGDQDITKTGYENIIKGAKEIIPDFPESKVITGFAGLRPKKEDANDYIIESSEKVSNFINVSVGSPGIDASPAISEEVVNLLEKEGLKCKEKADFNPYRKGLPNFRKMSLEEKNGLIKEDERYGHVVCRCETVTEGHIVEAINRGAKTLDGIKFRTRAGMGRCHGGFCTPRIVEILARELEKEVEDILKNEPDSQLLPYKTKELVGGNK